MDLNELLIFVRVLDAGGITGAARALGLPKSTVSRKLAQLEERLGARLVQRTTRSLRPTEPGLALYQRSARLINDLEAAEAAVEQAQSVPRGRLRLTAPVEFGTTFMGGMSAEFMLAHPEVDLEVLLTERTVELVEEGFDLAIRIGPLPDSNLVARRLDRVTRALYAAPVYLARHGTPGRPRDLARHRCLTTLIGEHTRWSFHGPERREESVAVEGRLVVNNLTFQRQAAEAGVGIANLPSFVCSEALRAGRLVQLLPDWRPAPAEIFAVYPSRRLLSPALQAFLGLMRERLDGAPWNRVAEEVVGIPF